MNNDIDYRAFVPSRTRKLLFTFAMILIGLFLGLAAGKYFSYQPPRPESSSAQQPAVDISLMKPGPDYEKAVIQATKKAIPAVVTVYTTGSRLGVYHSPNPFIDMFYGPQVRRQDITGTGSGVIVDPGGIIYTNDHVVDIENATEIKVVLPDGRIFEAKLQKRFPKQDLATLRIQGENLPWVEVASSSDVETGQTVLAVGNPFGTNLTEGLSGGEPTVTRGIISATRRNLTINQGEITRYYRNMFQTDAAINEGNSGGALIDLNGRLIGINTAIYDKGGGSIGIGFAIPTDRINLILENADKYGDVNDINFGFSISQLSSEAAERAGISSGGGVVVAETKSNGSAANAGLKKGDILIGINGLLVSRTEEVESMFNGFITGETVTLTVIRDDRKIRIKMKLLPMRG